jgi:hypothetical protein
MTVLADFQIIIGDAPQTINEVPPDAERNLGGKFRTGGRIPGTQEVDPRDPSSQSAFLMYSVRNMVGTAEVYLNDQATFVGRITPSSGTAWSTQVIAMGGQRLNDVNQGDNQITLKNVTDQFEIKDLICFYHQDSD